MQAAATRPIQQKPDRVVDFVPETLHTCAFSNSCTRSAAADAIKPNGVSSPIKRRASGTPVINVTFNGTQQFEMIVDTGASGTVITNRWQLPWEWWQWLKQRQIPPVPMRNFPLAISIQVGGAFVKDVPVAIAPSPRTRNRTTGHTTSLATTMSRLNAMC